MCGIDLDNLIKQLEFVLDNCNDARVVGMVIVLMISDIKDGMKTDKKE